ncbi:MAG: GGDEF domain-containing protein [Pseudomonadota bacterium]
MTFQAHPLPSPEQRFDRTAGDIQSTSATALQLGAQYGTPPTPRTYAVWYAYALQNPSELTAEIDRINTTGSGVDPYVVEHLYSEYLERDDKDGGRADIGHCLSSQLSNISRMVDEFADQAEKYTSDIEQIRDRDVSSFPPDQITRLLLDLMAQNRRMVSITDGLRQNLESSKKEVEILSIRLHEAERASEYDALTGILNRRGFDHKIAEMFDDAKKNKAALSLVLCDIDHFKRVNDRHGHSAGDHILRSFASILTASTEELGIVARYGGEEFAILLPESNAFSAHNLAVKIRSRISATNFILGQRRVRVDDLTASFGVASLSSSDSIHSLIENADQHLYKAKNSGRNTVKTSGI